MKIANLLYFFFTNAAAQDISGDVTVEFPATQASSTGEVEATGGGEVPKPRHQIFPWTPRRIDEILRPKPIPITGDVAATFETDAALIGIVGPAPVRGYAHAHASTGAQARGTMDRTRLDEEDEFIIMEAA